jgi:hypothetical protein
MLRRFLLMPLVTMVGCATNIPPGSWTTPVTKVGQYIQQTAQQSLNYCWQEPYPTPPPQQFAVVGDGGACVIPDFGDPCSACVLACAPPGAACSGEAPDAATIASAVQHREVFLLDLCPKRWGEQVLPTR